MEEALLSQEYNMICFYFLVFCFLFVTFCYCVFISVISFYVFVSFLCVGITK